MLILKEGRQTHKINDYYFLSILKINDLEYIKIVKYGNSTIIPNILGFAHTGFSISLEFKSFSYEDCQNIIDGINLAKETIDAAKEMIIKLQNDEP